MDRSPVRLTIAALAVACLTTAPSLASPDPALAAVKDANEKVHSALLRFSKAEGEARRKARGDAQAAVAGLLDFDRLAEATLGKERWSKLKPAERTRYSEALRGMMEASYLSRMQQGSVDVSQVRTEYLGTEPKGDRTLVKTKVVSGTDSAQVDYLVEKGKKSSKVVDVIAEGVSTAETYRDQINTLWPKKGFDGVVAAFEKKKKKFDAELADPKAAPAKP